MCYQHHGPTTARILAVVVVTSTMPTLRVMTWAIMVTSARNDMDTGKPDEHKHIHRLRAINIALVESCSEAPERPGTYVLCYLLSVM
jgi:hypothetical protein